MDAISQILSLATPAGGVFSAIGAGLGVVARWVQQAQIDSHEIRKAEMEHRHEMERLDRETALARVRGEIQQSLDELRYESEAAAARMAAAVADASSEWQSMRESLADAMKQTGNKLVDTLNGLQRPVIVYGLFLPYLAALFLSWATVAWQDPSNAVTAFAKVYVGFPELLLASIAGWLFADRTLRQYKRTKQG